MKRGVARRAVGAALAALLLAASPAGAAGPGGPARVRVLLSQDALPYQEALEGVRRSLGLLDMKLAVEVESLGGDQERARQAAQRARREGVAVLVTLGSLATRASIREAPQVPVVAGLILNADDLGGVRNATGVVLEFPVETEFRFLQRLLPRQKRIAVLYHAVENRGRVEAADRAARALGLRLEARRLASPRELPAALDDLSSDTDVLWGLADQVVLNPQTAQPILLFSLRHRIPFVGLSLTWVKAGALYALDRDYADIGAQCAELAARVLRGTPPSALPPAPPRKVVYALNLRTARHLNIAIPAPVVQAARTVIE
jgi:putative ABC transport system substrate-binding protein